MAEVAVQVETIRSQFKGELENIRWIGALKKSVIIILCVQCCMKNHRINYKLTYFQYCFATNDQLSQEGILASKIDGIREEQKVLSDKLNSLGITLRTAIAIVKEQEKKEALLQDFIGNAMVLKATIF